MRSSKRPGQATPGLAALLGACTLDPAGAIARADAGARAGLGRIVAFIETGAMRSPPDEQVRTALSRGLVLCGEAADEQELAMTCAPDDPDAPYSCAQSLAATASGTGRASEIARLALAGERGPVILFPLQEEGPMAFEACPPGFVEIGGETYEVRLLRNSHATLGQMADAARSVGASLPCPLAHAAWTGSAHRAFAEPVPYDGTERLICAVLDGDCLGVISQRGRWLEYESNHGSLTDYLEDAFEPGETGSFYLEGQGWTVSAIPYEQDADAGFDVTLKRAATAADARLLGDDMENVGSETAAYIEDART